MMGLINQIKNQSFYWKRKYVSKNMLSNNHINKKMVISIYRRKSRKGTHLNEYEWEFSKNQHH